MENIYQQAIADAKALRASAMANAKAALQEAFEPKIQEIVRLKLSEELEETEELEEGHYEDGKEMEEGHGASGDYLEGGIEETEELEESQLDEILAELEALSEDGEEEEGGKMEEGEDHEVKEEIEEANISYTYDEANFDEAKEDKEDEIEVSDDAEVKTDGEEETKEITVSLGDLKSVIDAIKGLAPELETDEMADDEAIADEEGEEAEEEEEELDETISLDEILAQLEEEEGKEKHHMEEKKHDKHEKEDMKKEEKELEEKKHTEKELEEAKKTIEALQESINEINLVNAKLLYMNKIFKAKSLTESQKIKVVKAFDRAESVKEVKHTYEVLRESVGAKKTQLQESFGYASKPAGVSPTGNVIDADPFVNRWQKLAGL